MSIWEYLALISGYFIHSSVCDEACACIYRDIIFKPEQELLPVSDEKNR